MCFMVRKKKLLALIVLIAILLVSFQRWTDTNATWKNTILMKLKRYQIELQQSIDFRNLEHIIVGNISNSNKTTITTTTDDDEDNDVKDVVPPNVKSLLESAKACLRQSRTQISVYLMKTFELEFSVEYRQNSVTKTILTPTCSGHLNLVIMLTTRPGAFYNRAAIRNSWGRMDSEINKMVLEGGLKDFKYKTVFIVGRVPDHKVEKLVEEEHNFFGDILRLDYKDSYDNLTNKTVLSLSWFADNCPTDYVLKTDDDCFVNMATFIPFLRQLDPSAKYIGKKNDFMPVIRDPTHRNYVPMHEYAEEFYKPYCSGGGYMIAGDVLKNLSAQAKITNQIINEDAYIGLVMHALNIKPVADDRFLPFVFTKKTVNKRTMCTWRDKFLMHGVDAEKQIHMHWARLAMREYPSLCDKSVNIPPSVTHVAVEKGTGGGDGGGVTGEKVPDIVMKERAAGSVVTEVKGTAAVVESVGVA